MAEDQVSVGAGGNQEVYFRQVHLEILLDIQQEMWSRRLELRGEVVAEIRSGRHQCVGNRS